MRACAVAWHASPRPLPRRVSRRVTTAKSKGGGASIASVKPERVDRLLSRLGYCTRSDAKKFYKRVTVDGVPVAKHDVKVLPCLDGHVLVDGEPLDFPDGLVVVLHKPAGFVCSHDDREGDNVYSLLPERWRNRNPTLEAVGRLDKDTTGLLIFTDDGRLSHQLTSPKKVVWKSYEVVVDVGVPDHAAALFQSGELLLVGEKKPCAPAKLTVDPTDRKKATLQLTEGKFHQVKRMMRSVGCEVTALHRAKFGDLGLGETREGGTFVLSAENLAKIFSQSIPDDD